MRVESNYSNVITTLYDWLKNIVSLFKPIGSKTKANRDLRASIFPRFEEVTLIATNSDWFIALFASVVNGQSNYRDFRMTWKTKRTRKHNSTVNIKTLIGT